MSSPRFSLIVPAYNAQDTIIDTLSSIKNQTYENYEVIVIDDGSSDNTSTTVEAWIIDDPRVCLYSQENGGVSSARNSGIAKSKGDYIVFVDSDDTIDPRTLEKFDRTSRAGKYDTLMCGMVQRSSRKDTVLYEYFENSRGVKGLSFDIAKLIRCKQLLSPCAKAYSRDVIVRHEITFEKNIHLGEDMLFNLEYFSKTQSYASVDYLGYIYMIGTAESLSKSVTSASFDGYKALYERAMQFCDKLSIDRAGIAAFSAYYLSCVYYGYGTLISDKQGVLRDLWSHIRNPTLSSAARRAAFSGSQGFLYAVPILLDSAILFSSLVWIRRFAKEKFR